jgi:hypothetical protein
MQYERIACKCSESARKLAKIIVMWGHICEVDICKAAEY